MNSKSPSPSPRSVAVDGTDSTPSLKQPAPLSGSQNVAQPSPSGRLSPQEVVSNLERGNREDESNELGIDSARRGPKKTQPPKKPSLLKKKKKKTQKVAAAVVASRQDFDAIDSLIAHNVRRTQQALSSEEVRLGAHHFAGSTGYGRGDSGRRALDAAVAALVGGEAAVARPHFVSGTHAIAAALFGVLRPGDELLAVAGKPYDTLDPVIGIGEGSLEGEGEEEGDDDERRRRRSSSSPPPSSSSSLGSLKDWGVSFRALPLDEASTAGGGSLDWEALKSAVRPETRVALVQRSCGYSSERNTLTLAEIARAASALKASAAMVGNTRLVVAVDNCYGEFTEEREPGSLEGVDLVMGSFIKGLGGTVAPCGGYVCGRAELVEAAAARATAPGVGLDYGAIEGSTLRLLFQGLWLVRFFWDVPPPFFGTSRSSGEARSSKERRSHLLPFTSFHF